MKTTTFGLAAACLFLAASVTKMTPGINDKKYLPVSSHYLPPPGIFGEIYNKNTWSNTTDFITNANSTATLSGGYINISCSNAYDWNNTIYITGYQTKLEKWKLKARFKIIAWAPNSYGIGFGLKSANAYIKNDVLGFIQTANTGTGGLYIVRSDQQVLNTGSAPLGVALNDVIDVEAGLYDSLFTFSAHNVTSGNSATVSYTFAPNGTTPPIPNTSHFTLLELGGTHQVQYLEISSIETTGANIATIGDSKTAGYFANTFAGRYGAQLNRNYPAAILNAGGADRIVNVLDRQEELVRLNANKYLLNIGSNDLRFGGTLTDLQANYDSLVRILQNTGAQVYHIVLPEDYTKANAVNMLAFKNWVAASYPANYINAWDSLVAGTILNGIYDTGDGIHLNQQANDKVYEAIIASGKLAGGVTLPVTLYSFDVREISPGKAFVSWKTDPDQQAELYSVLKSTDGRYFYELARLPGNRHGNYGYTDTDLGFGKCYYKLKMTEANNAVTYSKIITVNGKRKDPEIISVRQAGQRQVLIVVRASSSSVIQWQVADVTGRIVKRGKQLLQNGVNNLDIYVPGFEKEINYLRLTSLNNEELLSMPFIR